VCGRYAPLHRRGQHMAWLAHPSHREGARPVAEQLRVPRRCGGAAEELRVARLCLLTAVERLPTLHSPLRGNSWVGQAAVNGIEQLYASQAEQREGCLWHSFASSFGSCSAQSCAKRPRETALPANRFSSSRDSCTLERFGGGEAAKGQLPPLRLAHCQACPPGWGRLRRGP
jgi:hypothetical protein